MTLCPYRTTISYVAKAGPKAGQKVSFKMQCKEQKGHAFWHILGEPRSNKEAER